MAVLNKYMDAAAELESNPVSKHQIQPEYGDEQADAGRDCRTRLARPNSQAGANADRKISIFPVQLTTCRIGNLLTWLIHTIAIYFVPASPDQGHDRPCRRDVGRVFLAGVRPDSPSRRRIPSCYRPGPGRGMVVELGQRGAH